SLSEIGPTHPTSTLSSDSTAQTSPVARCWRYPRSFMGHRSPRRIVWWAEVALRPPPAHVIRRPSCLRCRHGRAVCRHDLRLISKDLPGSSVHEHLHPMDIVVAVRLVVAERLDASEVLQPAPLRVQERLVDAEVVRVAMHPGDRPAEGDHLVAQRDEELLIAV